MARRTVLEEYPYCREIIESGYPALSSSISRNTLYIKTNNERFVFENPLYRAESSSKNGLYSYEENNLQMGTKDFLASIPAFADFSDDQLTKLEQNSSVSKFESGEIIFRQGDEGDMFYVINQGAVDVLIQDRSSLFKNGDLGKVVNKLTEGCYFGERALMTSELRAASIRCVKDTVCLLFSRAVYEDIISNSNALIGQDDTGNVDWSKDHETRSLFRHIENILEIGGMDASPKIKRILYELSTAFTPELSADEVISRMVMTVKIALKVDRVGLFVLSEDKKSMVLKVSERSKGVRLPVRGLAGAVLQSNTPINIPDAYQDARFDATMDRRSGYRTRQVLGVPLREPVSGEPIGLLQVNNRLDGSDEGFSAEQQRVLELAAEQLNELLHGREDVFIHTGSVRIQKSYGQGVGDGMVILNSSELNSPFQMELFALTVGQQCSEVIHKEGLLTLEIQISLHLALGQLCKPVVMYLDVPVRQSSNGSEAKLTQIQIKKRVDFDILVKDLPRAARVLFRLYGYRKKKNISPHPSNTLLSSSGEKSVNKDCVALGWVAATLFDFKGCLDCMKGDLRMFDCGDAEVTVPINTTLNNSSDPQASCLRAVFSPDLVLTMDESSAPRVRIVHNMVNRVDPIEGDQLGTEVPTEEQESELDRILQLSFNPLSGNLMTDADKDFLWALRYKILNRPELLPPFVMSVNWASSEQVQELYDLLDLWAPPTAVQSLQLLDRRFMDPKVRAYAVHCLEELQDEELSLYLLQLCQQLKFENHVDSALSRFLLRRALTNQKLIGHIFFWQLQSEVYNKDVSKRFVILLQIFIQHCGRHRVELGHQMFVMRRLEHVAQAVAQGETKERRKQILKDRLSEIVLPSTFKLPLNPHLTVCSIDVSRCRVMESKKKPLWLTLIDADGKDLVLMLKVGDDLRQDALILQLLRVMDDLWKREGLDMQMMLYDCISTGEERGLLQIVLNASTLGNILMEATDKGKTKSKSGSLSRKLNSALRALSDFDVLAKWIRTQTEKDIEDESLWAEEYERRVNNFTISTAAYCVASYVLGLGDRHNDNLMMTRSGHFFHIDFGHILGNFKSKLGVKRERAPFVFTPAMKEVMRDADGSKFEAFVDLCCDSYNTLRDHSMLLVSLFSLAIPCNLPELQTEKDVMWIYDKLLVGADDDEASEHFQKQLDLSLNTRGTRLNDAAHMLAHA